LTNPKGVKKLFPVFVPGKFLNEQKWNQSNSP